jgi:hypothetical protein
LCLLKDNYLVVNILGLIFGGDEQGGKGVPTLNGGGGKKIGGF